MGFSPIQLEQHQRVMLANLTMHPGWVVLTDLLDKQLREATEQVIKCDPLDEKKIVEAQRRARYMNEFVAYLRQQVVMNCNAVLLQKEQEALDEVETIAETI